MSRSSRESQGPELAVIAGSAHPALASEIARALGAPELPVAIERFPDGELSAVVLGPVRGRIAVIVQPTGPPVDEHLVELLALTDACRRAAAGRVVAVVPYFGYARGDRRGGCAGRSWRASPHNSSRLPESTRSSRSICMRRRSRGSSTYRSTI